MNSWAPLFAKIVHSSLWAEPDYVCKIFVTMMAVKDADHIVRHTAYAIGRLSHKTEQEVLKALEILMAPDKSRVEPQPYDGRRVEKVEAGYLILNGQYYEDLMRMENRRVYQAKKAREYRANKKTSAPPPGEATYLKAVESGATESELDQIINQSINRNTP